MAKDKVVLAYSGGLDTSVILKWLQLKGFDVVAYVADLGQLPNVDEIREKAMASGAVDFYAINLQEEFVKELVYTAVKFNALYEGRYLLGTSLARPIITKGMVDVAHKSVLNTSHTEQQEKVTIRFVSSSPQSALTLSLKILSLGVSLNSLM